MDLPLLVPVPPAAVRQTIPNEEWEVILDAWILLTELRIQIPDKDFSDCACANNFNSSFLSSYFVAYHDVRLHGAGQNNDNNFNNVNHDIIRKARRLRKAVFLLTRRYYLDVNPTGDELLDWRLLGDFAECYRSSSALKELLIEVWNRHGEKLSASVENGKDGIVKQLQQKGSTTTVSELTDIRRLTILASMLPQVGHVLMTGSDYLDSLHDAYRSSLTSDEGGRGEALRSALVANAYVGFTSLLKVSKPNLSLLLDHLFTLKVSSGVGSTAKSSRTTPELLSDLVCSTDLLVRIERFLVSAPQKRAQDLVSSLRAYQQEMKQLHHRHQRHKKRNNKGKTPVTDLFSGGNALHAHRLSLITQIQDLFPDLGGGYILRLMHFYNEETETVVAHLLEDSLADELKSLDKSEPLPDIPHVHDVMEPHHTPPELLAEPNFTRNINMLDDEIIQSSRSAGGKKLLHFGRANTDSTADAILADRSQHAANKAAILSALATFDSDDDERDDTYDVADVGGTVDAGTENDAEGERERRNRAEEIDITLYRVWKSSPAQFARDSTTRRSQPRNALKHETGMTDEAIEGWALMLQRDSKKQTRLESKLALAGPAAAAATAQPQLMSTAYRKPKTEENTEDSETASDGDYLAGNARGRGRGGRGGGGAGGGGSSRGRGGPSRGGRGANRGRGANHRRRDQHAKKMARAGALPT